jgi:NAD(P)-dependent dehydrogenase (short-subunit alcohol dehydrogenase family)
MIAVVTGASRGAGKGIAVALGEAGMAVYVTGRSVEDADTPYGGTIAETAELVSKAGGEGIAVAVDHADDRTVAALFDRIRQDRGKIDILVNNAASVMAIVQSGGFWEKPLNTVDLINVGLRSHYVASYHAAPLLIANGKGLIVNTGHYGVPLSATQPDCTTKDSLRAATAEIRQKPLQAAVAKLWPAISPSPSLIQRPTASANVVKSSVVDDRPLPPTVTAA